MKKQIVFLFLLGSIFTALNSCYFSTKKEIEKRHLEIKMKEDSLKFKLVWSETYEEEGKKIKIDKLGKDCSVVWVAVTNPQDSIREIYDLAEYYNKRTFPLEYVGIYDPSIFSAVTDTTNGKYFFGKEIEGDFFGYLQAITKSEKKIIQKSLSKCNCEEKLGVDYNKIIGWVY